MPDDSRHRDMKKQLEAMLFASGRKMAVEELARLCRTTASAVQQQLQELKAEYEAKDSSLLLIDEADGWKLTVKEQYTRDVQKIVSETELTKTVIETLAVIAWRAPVLQSEVIKVRTNKAYDHIAAIEKAGFITKERKGRSQLIKLTDRFFRYFDLQSQEDIRQKLAALQPAPVPPSPPQAATEPDAPQPAQPEAAPQQ